MQPSHFRAAALATALLSLSVHAQDMLGNVAENPDHQLMLKFATFDPVAESPAVPAGRCGPAAARLPAG